MKTSVRIEGLKELDAALGQLPKATAKTVLRKVLTKAGTPIQEEAQGRAPVRRDGSPQRTYKTATGLKVRRVGTLKALVQIGTRLTKRQASQARKAGKDFTEVYVGTRDRIARFEEYGTVNAPPQPFLRPAWDHGKAQALETIKEELGGEIARAAARLAKKTARLAAKAGG